MRLLTTFFLCLLFTSSCKDINESTFSTTNTDSVKVHIPRYENGKPQFAYVSASKAASQLHLDSLELGYDSIQIRIWYGFSKAEFGQIFILKKNAIKWSAESLVIRYVWNSKTLSSSLSDTVTRVTYNKDLNPFIKQLFDLKIATMDDMDDIAGYKDEGAADGNGCEIEIATRNSYRFFGYWAPGHYKNQYWQARNMIAITELIEREFNFKPLMPL